jgi:hypothetical protein
MNDGFVRRSDTVALAVPDPPSSYWRLSDCALSPLSNGPGETFVGAGEVTGQANDHTDDLAFNHD